MQCMNPLIQMQMQMQMNQIQPAFFMNQIMYSNQNMFPFQSFNNNMNNNSNQMNYNNNLSNGQNGNQQQQQQQYITISVPNSYQQFLNMQQNNQFSNNFNKIKYIQVAY